MEKQNAIDQVKNLESYEVPVGVKKDDLVEMVDYLVSNTTLSPRESQVFSIVKICESSYTLDEDDVDILLNRLGIENKSVYLQRARDKEEKSKNLSSSIDFENKPKKRLFSFKISAYSGDSELIKFEVMKYLLNDIYMIKVEEYTDGLNRNHICSDTYLCESSDDVINKCLETADDYNSNVNKSLLKSEIKDFLNSNSENSYRLLDVN